MVACCVLSLTVKRMWPVVRPTTPRTGGRNRCPCVPIPRRLLARQRGGSSGSSCFSPFSPAFWNSSSASVTASVSGAVWFVMSSASVVRGVPPIQHRLIIQFQLVDQLEGRCPLRKNRAAVTPSSHSHSASRSRPCRRHARLNTRPHIRQR